MRSLKLKSIFSSFALLFFCVMSTTSYAAICEPHPQNGVFNVGPVSVSSNTPRGTPLSGWIASGTRRSHTQCVFEGPRGDTFYTMFNTAGQNWGVVEIEGSTYLLQATHLAGIGVIARGGAYGAAPTIPISDGGFTILGAAGSNSNYGEANIEIRLIATGNKIDGVYSGAVSPGRTFVRDCRGTTDCYGKGTGSQDVLWYSTVINFVKKTCSVTSKDIMFALPPMRSSDFPAVGSTAGSITKNLQLNCSSSPDVHMVISDQTTPSNRSSTLTLTPDSAAKGFGIEVLHNNSPVRFGPDSAMAGTENQFSVGKGLSGAISIPLTARYVRTSSNITAGSVKGLATFTMSYQ